MTIIKIIRKPASSLLIVVVSMTAISAVILAGSAALLTSAHQRAVSDSARIAQTAAERGMELGVQELGAAPASDSPTAFSQVFGRSDTMCPPDASGQTPSAQECGYTMNSENFVTLSNAHQKEYVYTTRELPHAVPIWLTINPDQDSTSVGLSFQMKDSILDPKFRSFDYQACYKNFGAVEECGDARFGGVGITSQTIDLPAGQFRWSHIRLTVNYVLAEDGLPYLTAHIPVMYVTKTDIGGADVKISKGFTTIDSVGINGGINRHLLMVVRPFDRATPRDIPATPQATTYTKTMWPLADAYDAYGFCTSSLKEWTGQKVFDVNDDPTAAVTEEWAGRDDCR